MPRVQKEDNSLLEAEEMSPCRGGRVSIFLLLFLLIVAIGGFVWSYTNYTKAREQIALLSTQEGQLQVAEQEIGALLSDVGQHILLPEGESPVVATVQDAVVLASQQAFYKDVQNGDKLLVYRDKAIIYSPARDRIINVGPVYIQDGDQLRNAAEVATEADTRIKVEIRNGTPTTGLARTSADTLNSELYNVVSIVDAVNNEYTAPIIVNLGGVNTSGLESQFNVSAVGQLPAGEAGSSADVVIILGQPKPAEPATE